MALQAGVERSPAGESRGICGENALRQGTAAAPSATPRHAETSAVRKRRAGGARLSGLRAMPRRVGVVRRERHEAGAEHRGARRRSLRSGDGPSDARGSAASGAKRDIDAKDAGEGLHPRQARRGSITELSVEQGCDGGEFELAARDEEGELLGRGLGLVGTRHDGTAQGVVGRQDAVVQNGVCPRWWDQGAQPGEKGVGGHLGEGGPEAVSPACCSARSSLRRCSDAAAETQHRRRARPMAAGRERKYRAARRWSSRIFPTLWPAHTASGCSTAAAPKSSKSSGATRSFPKHPRPSPVGISARASFGRSPFPPCGARSSEATSRVTTERWVPAWPTSPRPPVRTSTSHSRTCR